MSLRIEILCATLKRKKRGPDESLFLVTRDIGKEGGNPFSNDTLFPPKCFQPFSANEERSPPAPLPFSPLLKMDVI